ncbi:hypothetical protein [Nocardia kruczakiae]|uniref:hypothetical protein n=1 Tax=Nocardia kruczakiae TaxID=261477 RepID=UPI0007A3E518|nr:hypothetical protein [Nocardia kruczakiae]
MGLETVFVLISGPEGKNEIAAVLTALFGVEPLSTNGNVDREFSLGQVAWLVIEGEGWDPWDPSSPYAVYEWDILVDGGPSTSDEHLGRWGFDVLTQSTSWPLAYCTDHISAVRSVQQL